MAMSAASPNAAGRRLAIGLLLAAVVIGVAAVGLPFWLLFRHYDSALADSVKLAARYERIAGMRANVARQLDAIRASEPRKLYLRSGGPALSAAEAQEALRGLIESGGGRLITMQAPTYKEEGRYRQISVNVQLTANIFALRRILNAIETNVPYLFVENLMVRTQVPATFRPQPGQEPEVFVQLDVTGYAPTGS
jgi:general secretion pathway protein M